MPELSSFTRQRPLTVSVDVAGEPVEFVFDGNAVTPRWMETNLVDGLALALLSWNLTENGQPLELSKENLDRMPYPVLTLLTERLIQAAAPASAEGNASRNISSTAATDSTSKPEPLLNGQETSQLPKPSDVPSVT
jgi:hypothetical protein